jgi:hypothetical protein
MLTGTTQSVLGRANVALDRGRGAEAAQLLSPVLRAGGLNKNDEAAVRAALTAAWLTT